MADESRKPVSTNRIERKKERTRRRIITVAIQLIQQYGFDTTTMEQIAEETDIAKGTLYNYFPAKEAIISAYIQQTFEERHADRIHRLREMPDTQSRLTLILRELMAGVLAQQDVFEIYLAYRIRDVVSLRPDMREGGKSAFGALAAEIIQLGREGAEIRADLPLMMLVELFEFVFVEVAKPFYLEPATYDVDTAIAQGVSLFMHGVTNVPD